MYWLYVGKRGHYKNFGTLLRAFIKASSQIDCYLVAVGGEPVLEPWQEDLLIKNRLEQRVLLLHNINDSDLSNAYTGASAFIYPSLEEGFGIPLLEAMNSGTPIAASDIPVFKEVAADAACYFDPYDENMLADVMTKLLDKKISSNLIKRGKERIKHFSWDKAANQLSQVYMSLV